MTEATRIDAPAIRQKWPLPDPADSSDKDERGRVVVIGGATQTPGAVLLAGLAALRAGAGKLTMATTAPTAAALAVAVPEAAVISLPCTPEGAISPGAAAEVAHLVEDCDAVLLGPGMADPPATKEFVSALIRDLDRDAVLVLDALAASCGVVEDGLGGAAARTVITPNETEACHLLGDSDGSEAERATRISERHGVVTTLGSTLSAPNAGCWLIPKGNPGLGTSGSGDVLAGAVAGIAARTRDPVTAAAWGLLLHGSAGDRLAARIGKVGFLARELLGELPYCLEQLSG